MFDFAELKSAKKKSSENLEDKNKIVDEYVDQFIALLEEFFEKKDFNLLKLATEPLLQAIELKPSDAELYVCLAYVFYQMNAQDEAEKYLNLAQELAPDSAAINEILSFI